MKNTIIALIAGMIMGFGLCVSQMVYPEKIVAFLDISGHWDPSLIFVMAGALFVSAISFHYILKLNKPFCDAQFMLPKRTGIDFRLISGSALFGVGWGLAGFCPGPAITSLAFGARGSYVFVAAMLVGMILYKFLANTWLRKAREART